MRIGFVRLIDAAPLIIAREKGFFAAAGVNATLHREIGWINIRDKLTYGLLDASHALMGMAVMSQLGRGDFVEPLVGVMELGAGGNTLAVSRHLAEMGITSSAALGNLVRTGLFGRKIVCAHVSSFSMHHYLLRDWLAEGGMNPDRDVQLCQLTPMQVAEHMDRGYIDLFCVGEPWGTLAQEQKWGTVIAASTDILPAHPEKILAVRQHFVREHAEEVSRAVGAIIQACRFCQNPVNTAEIAAILSQPEYLNESAQLLERCLRADSPGTGGAPAQRARPKDWFLRNWGDAYTFPSCTHVVWMLRQMMRWGELAADAPVRELSERSLRSDFYRVQAAKLGMAPPPTDFPDMPLRRGVLTMKDETCGPPRNSPAGGASVAASAAVVIQPAAQRRARRRHQDSSPSSPGIRKAASAAGISAGTKAISPVFMPAADGFGRSAAAIRR